MNSLRQPIPLDILDRDLAEMVFDLPVHCVCNGASFTASASDETIEMLLRDHGYAHQSRLEIVVRDAAVLGTTLRTEDLIVVSGRPMYIDTITINQDQVSKTLSLRRKDP